MIPTTMKYNAEGSTPVFSEADGTTVEKGSQVRVRIKGIRGELGQMFAIGSIKEDYLGWEFPVFLMPIHQLLTSSTVHYCNKLS
jgi:hypothetical protein